MIDIRDHTHKGLTYIILSKALHFLSEWSVFWTDLFHKCPCSDKFPLEKNVKHKLDQLGGISVEKNQEESAQYIPG